MRYNACEMTFAARAGPARLAQAERDRSGPNLRIVAGFTDAIWDVRSRALALMNALRHCGTTLADVPCLLRVSEV